jgi:carboxymethylenebutenolidase
MSAVEMEDMAKGEADNDKQMLSEAGAVSSSEPTPASVDKNSVTIPKSFLYILITVVVALASVVTYLGVSLTQAYNNQDNGVNPCGLTPDEMVALWNTHTYSEFVTRDVNETMTTFGPNPYIFSIPTRAGGNSTQTCDTFYKEDFTMINPPDIGSVLISRTIGDYQIVDETVASFTHTTEMGWILPGIPPTNKFVQIPLVVIVGFADSKIAYEHIYWDQASVLAQVGLLNKTCCSELSNYSLPIIGADEDNTIPIQYLNQ